MADNSRISTEEGNQVIRSMCHNPDENRSIRVLHVISGVDTGGAETQLLALCDGLTDAGFDITIAYLKGDGELADDFREAGCRVVRVGIRMDADPFGFARLLSHVYRNDYDVVNGHLFHGNVYGVAAGRLGGVPVVVSSKHNDPPFWNRQPWRTLHEMTLSTVDAVFPISENVRQYLLEMSRVDAGKVETIRYGLDPDPFRAVSDAEIAAVRGEFPGDYLIGTVARLTEQKDLGTLLRAFASLTTNYDITGDVHLAIVGRGEQEDELRRLAVGLGVDEAVTFTGFRDDVPALLNAFDVFVLPSRWEGTGVVFLEAMAAETPIVASDTSAIPEVVNDEETGILCSPGDIEAFADAIAHLLSHPCERKRVGQAGGERLDKEFTVEQMVAAYSNAYNRLLRNAR